MGVAPIVYLMHTKAKSLMNNIFVWNKLTRHVRNYGTLLNHFHSIDATNKKFKSISLSCEREFGRHNTKNGTDFLYTKII